MGLAGGATDDWYITQPGVTFSGTIELPEKDRQGSAHAFSLPPSEIIRVRSSSHGPSTPQAGGHLWAGFLALARQLLHPTNTKSRLSRSAWTGTRSPPKYRHRGRD